MTAPDLARTLEGIRRDALAGLRRERIRADLGPALHDALWAMTAVALVYLLSVAAFHLLGSPLDTPARGVIWLTILVPGATAFVLRLFPVRSAIADGAVFTAVDQRHGLQDRLRTAREFLDRDAPTPFMTAAIRDAERFALRAQIRGLPPVAPPPVLRGARSGWLASGWLLLLAGALWLPAPAAGAVPTGAEDTPAVAKLDPGGEAEEPVPAEEPMRAEPSPETPNRPVVHPPGIPARGTGREDSRLDTEVEKSRGTMGSGQSADASSASSNSEARGAPSSQAQASLSGKKPGKRKKKQRKSRKPPDGTATPPKKPEDDSGATAGRGAASGSNKSPAASPWASKDQVTSEDEEDLEDDEEVDDEFDNSDARGGVQPNLRDRRPPVNRDLGIGFGNGKNPDANGRGGPSEMKKSRGVASLVLGVPIPDHIKGRPNPGKTKITQERVEPRVEEPAGEDATARTPRAAPLGRLANPVLEPWMRELIRNYFKAIRATGAAATAPQRKSGD